MTKNKLFFRVVVIADFPKHTCSMLLAVERNSKQNKLSKSNSVGLKIRKRGRKIIVVPLDTRTITEKVPVNTVELIKHNLKSHSFNPGFSLVLFMLRC